MAPCVQGLPSVHTHSLGDLGQSQGFKYSVMSPKATHQPSLCTDIKLLLGPLHLDVRRHLQVTIFKSKLVISAPKFCSPPASHLSK